MQIPVAPPLSVKERETRPFVLSDDEIRALQKFHAEAISDIEDFSRVIERLDRIKELQMGIRHDLAPSARDD